MDAGVNGNRVAVIGLGLTGVATLKNFLEAGFDAVGFERHERLGGLWVWSRDTNQTTVLKSTRTNSSKQRNCYSDFPFPDDVPDYPNAEQVAQYIGEYANHFKLKPHCRLGITVERVERSSDGRPWTIQFTPKDSNTTIDTFDKVVITNGGFHRPFIPRCEVAESFKGTVMHAQGFKDPQEFASKRIVIVGFGNTGADAAVDLAQVASKVYLAHRSGARIISRQAKGPPFDHKLTRRITNIEMRLSAKFPRLVSSVGGYLLDQGMRRDNPTLQESWNVLPAPPLFNVPPIMNDHILSHFASGSVESVAGIQRFSKDGISIELTDGTVLSCIDAVIWCTGYCTDFSMLAPEADPTNFPTPEWDSSPHANGLPYPRLYQGILSTTYPQSLAFIGPYEGHTFAAFTNADLSSLAIAQIWSGNYPLPSTAEIEKWCNENYASQLASIAVWRVAKVSQTSSKELETWLNAAAGNGMNEYLGWGWQGWKFWWKENELYRLIMDGIDTPFVYRLFDGRRQKWEGAREEIYRVNGKGIKAVKGD